MAHNTIWFELNAMHPDIRLGTCQGNRPCTEQALAHVPLQRNIDLTLPDSDDDTVNQSTSAIGTPDIITILLALYIYTL